MYRLKQPEYILLNVWFQDSKIHTFNRTLCMTSMPVETSLQYQEQKGSKCLHNNLVSCADDHTIHVGCRSRLLAQMVSLLGKSSSQDSHSAKAGKSAQFRSSVSTLSLFASPLVSRRTDGRSLRRPELDVFQETAMPLTFPHHVLYGAPRQPCPLDETRGSPHTPIR